MRLYDKTVPTVGEKQPTSRKMMLREKSYSRTYRYPHSCGNSLRISFIFCRKDTTMVNNHRYYTPPRCSKRHITNHNHQLNWWFALALKGPYASSVSRRTEKVCQPHDFLRLRLKALFYYLLFLATRERVDIFFHTYLVICDVLLQLISDVLFYRFFVSSNCIYIISSTPEMSISIFIF